MKLKNIAANNNNITYSKKGRRGVYMIGSDISSFPFKLIIDNKTGFSLVEGSFKSLLSLLSSLGVKVLHIRRNALWGENSDVFGLSPVSIYLQFYEPVVNYSMDHIRLYRIIRSGLCLMDPPIKISNKGLESIQKRTPELFNLFASCLCTTFTTQEGFYNWFKSPRFDVIRSYYCGQIKIGSNYEAPSYAGTYLGSGIPKTPSKEDEYLATLKTLIASNCGSELRRIADSFVLLREEALRENSKEKLNRLWASSRAHKKRISYLLSHLGLILGEDYDLKKEYVAYLDRLVGSAVSLLTPERTVKTGEAKLKL